MQRLCGKDISSGIAFAQGGTAIPSWRRGRAITKTEERPPEVAIKREEPVAGEEPLAVDGSAPFMLLLPITDGLPTRLSGQSRPSDAKLRIAAFGDPDWKEKAGKWIGGNGSFRFGNRLHPGVMGQAFAKIAHAYACAVLGPEGFDPFLSDYILAKEPAFDLQHIGIFASEGTQDAMHYIDLQIAEAPIQTVIGVGKQQLIVAYIRLFAMRPSPAILVVIGKPKTAIAQSLKKMNLDTLPI